MEIVALARQPDDDAADAEPAAEELAKARDNAAGPVGESRLIGVAGGELIIPALICGFGVGVKVAGTLSLSIGLPTVTKPRDREGVGFTISPSSRATLSRRP